MAPDADLRQTPVGVGDVEGWMGARSYASVAQMRGSMSQHRVADPAAFQRANYIRILENYRNPYASG